MEILAVKPLRFKEACALERKNGYPYKNGCFTDIASSIMKTVARRHSTDILLMITSTSDELFRSVNIDDLE